ncbi:Alpha/Beta hydrolase protein [Irpex lacteus]|nr:Alpha/Beta hydrolase protein [Irpex lacteus]
MPSIKVNSRGTELYYEDSGVPVGSTSYSTVILVHGYYFHSAMFRPMFNHAKSHDLRFVSINLREYPGTTNLSESELANFASSDLEDQANALINQAVDVARLILYVIKQENIPPPQRSGSSSTGGVSVMAWSSGTLMVNAMLANLPVEEKEAYDVLSSYITKVIYYDAPNIAFGIADPPKTTYPLKSLSMSTEEAHDAFLTWTSTYWQPFPDLKSVDSTSIQQRKPMTDISSDPQYKPTRDRRAPAEIEGIMHAPVKYRIGPALVDWKVFMANTRRALFDTRGTWKGVNVLMSYGDMGPWTTQWAARVMTEMLAEPKGDGEQRRDVKIVCLENANHFLPYDDPGRFVRFIAENI